MFPWGRGKEEKGVCCSLCVLIPPQQLQSQMSAGARAGGGSSGCSCPQRDSQDILCPHPFSTAWSQRASAELASGSSLFVQTQPSLLG